VDAPVAEDGELLAAGAVGAAAEVAGDAVVAGDADSDDLPDASLDAEPPAALSPETGGTVVALPPSRKSVTYQPEPFN
jgi:hypothetical protein